MKIQIDLENILGDEYGSETLQESIKRQVVEQVANEAKKETKNAINKAVETSIQKQVDESIASIVESGLNEEYTPTTQFGEESKPISLRKRIKEIVAGLVEYKKTSYSSDKNSFTQAVDGALEEVVRESTEEIRKSVDYEFKKKVLADAVKHIKSNLNIN